MVWLSFEYAYRLVRSLHGQTATEYLQVRAGVVVTDRLEVNIRTRSGLNLENIKVGYNNGCQQGL